MHIGRWLKRYIEMKYLGWKLYFLWAKFKRYSTVCNQVLIAIPF